MTTTPHILIVDDHREIRDALVKYLEKSGMRASSAANAVAMDAALKVGAFDLIVLDVMMPRLDGYETVKKLRESPVTEKIPVVIVTALNDVSNQLKAIEAGADDFLSKPIEEKLLIAKVKLLSTVNLERKKVSALKELLIQNGGADALAASGIE